MAIDPVTATTVIATVKQLTDLIQTWHSNGEITDEQLEETADNGRVSDSSFDAYVASVRAKREGGES